MGVYVVRTSCLNDGIVANFSELPACYTLYMAPRPCIFLDIATKKMVPIIKRVSSFYILSSSIDLLHPLQRVCAHGLEHGMVGA